MNRTIHVVSGHTLFVSSISREELPENLQHAGEYTTFYRVQNWDAHGVTFFYLGKGHKNAPKQIVAWYPKGAFWASFGNTIKEAIEGAQRDGWMYA